MEAVGKDSGKSITESLLYREGQLEKQTTLSKVKIRTHRLITWEKKQEGTLVCSFTGLKGGWRDGSAVRSMDTTFPEDLGSVPSTHASPV